YHCRTSSIPGFLPRNTAAAAGVGLLREPRRAVHTAPVPLADDLLQEGRGTVRPIERAQLPPDTAGMAKKLEPPKPTSWDVYKIAKKAMGRGTGEAPEKQGAVEKAAQEFKPEVWRLYGGGRR